MEQGRITVRLMVVSMLLDDDASTWPLGRVLTLHNSSQ